MPTPNRFAQSRAVTAVRAFDPEWAAVPSDVLGEIVKRVDLAYAAMWRKRKAGEKASDPRWPKRSDEVGLIFRGDTRGMYLLGIMGRFAFWKLSGATDTLGALKVRWHRPIPSGATIQQVHVNRDSLGWFLSFSCAIPLSTVNDTAAPKAINGVDLNVIHVGNYQQVAAVDDGRVYRVTSHLKRNSRRLAQMQRRADPKRRVKGTAKAADPHSKRTARRRVKIVQLHSRITRQRLHAQHYIARRLVDTAEVTAFEQLNHQGMRRKGKGRRKSGLNRALSTAAPGKLIALTREKAEAARRTVVTVNARNTSQACSACGAVGTKKGLGVRQWTCAECGARHDRDINAARNVRKRAEEYLASSGIQPVKENVPGEGAAGEASERPSANLEAASHRKVAWQQAASNAASAHLRRPIPRPTPIGAAEQIGLFDAFDSG